MKIYLYYGYEFEDTLIKRIHKKASKMNDEDFSDYLSSLTDDYNIDIHQPLKCVHATEKQKKLWILGYCFNSFDIGEIESIHPDDFSLDGAIPYENDIDCAINELMLRNDTKTAKPFVYAVVGTCQICKN
jgi:hypothetical protein